MKLAKLIMASSLILAATAASAHESKLPIPSLEKAMLTSPAKHSGGTDSKGCHTNSKTGDYHCHKPKPKK